MLSHGCVWSGQGVTAGQEVTARHSISPVMLLWTELGLLLSGWLCAEGPPAVEDGPGPVPAPAPEEQPELAGEHYWTAQHGVL